MMAGNLVFLTIRITISSELVLVHRLRCWRSLTILNTENAYRIIYHYVRVICLSIIITPG
jgi:hypothetical protein